MRSIEIKPGGSLQTVYSPRRIVCKRPVGQTIGRARRWASDRNRARVSFVVLQKSKSRVWHRGSASTAKSGTGVHGCLGRCRSLRPTSGANVAIEGTLGRVIVAAKPRHAPSSLALTETWGRARHRASGPRSRKSSLRWKTPWVVNAEDLHGSLARSGLGSVGEQVAPLEGEAGSRRIDRGVRDSVGKGCARKKTPRTSARSIRLSPLSRRETRCGSVARPKGASHKSSSEHGSLKLTCPRGATSLRSHEARVLAPECDDGRNRSRASRVASVEESQDESMGAKLAQASADPAMTRPAAEAWAKRCSVLFTAPTEWNREPSASSISRGRGTVERALGRGYFIPSSGCRKCGSG